MMATPNGVWVDAAHVDVIKQALAGWRKYVNATEPTFDMARHNKVKRLDAALAALDSVPAAPQPPALDAPRFSHRNGETDEPTVAGYYWFVGKLHHAGYFHVVKDLIEIIGAYPTNELIYDGEECRHVMGDFEGEWYGPIVPPWDAPPVQARNTE
jgi:hypothetical protein